MSKRRREEYFFRKPFFTRRERTALAILTLLSAVIAFTIPAIRYFRTLTGAMAVSNASDTITKSVSDIVNNKMREIAPQQREYVTFLRDVDGEVSAIVTNTSEVNILSSELLNAVVEASDKGDLDLHIPLGNLLGLSFLLGKGPDIPVKITMLTSSRVNFRNALSDAGINQTRHQLLLQVVVDVDVLLPWEISSASISTEVLVAETIIVGHVPETYVTMGE